MTLLVTTNKLSYRAALTTLRNIALLCLAVLVGHVSAAPPLRTDSLAAPPMVAPTAPVLAALADDPAENMGTATVAGTPVPCAPARPTFSTAPASGATLDFEGSYAFSLLPTEGAEGYLWEFFQNGTRVATKIIGREANGNLSTAVYIVEASEEHARFVPGALEVRVAASVCSHYGPTAARFVALMPRAAQAGRDDCHPNPAVFTTPANASTLHQTDDYQFAVQAIHVQRYRWTVYQGNMKILDNDALPDAATAATFVIPLASMEHQRIKPGGVEVRIEFKTCGYYTDPMTLTVFVA